MIRPATAAPPWSAAPSFLDVVGTALGSPVAVDVGGCVVLCNELYGEPVLTVTFSWKIPGNTVGKLELDGDDGETELEELLEAELSEYSDALVAGDEGSSDEDDELPVEPSTLNTTILAVLPFGTVTTQNWAPPTPVVETGLVNPPIPSSAGLIEHGRPLQPPPSHSTLIPYVGRSPHSDEAVQIGFHPILKKVCPEASVLPPATYGLQLPIGLLSSPQTHPSDDETPGGLM